MIAASSFKNKATVKRGAYYKLQVTLTMPALTPGRRLAEEQEEKGRELKGINTAPMNKKPTNTADYALMVTVPAGGAASVTYKRSSVRPAPKPASLKKPAVQQNGDLLWASVPMPRYMSKAYTRKFMVRKANGMKGWCVGGRVGLQRRRGTPAFESWTPD
jgi:hypothetical protein